MTISVSTSSPLPEVVEERDARVAELDARGWHAHEIARIVGVTERSVQRSRRRNKKRQGLLTPRTPPLTEEERRQALIWLEDGAPYAEVARSLGRNPDTIAEQFRGMSRCGPREGQQIRHMMRQLEELPVRIYRKEGHA